MTLIQREMFIHFRDVTFNLKENMNEYKYVNTFIKTKRIKRIKAKKLKEKERLTEVGGVQSLHLGCPFLITPHNFL